LPACYVSDCGLWHHLPAPSSTCPPSGCLHVTLPPTNCDNIVPLSSSRSYHVAVGFPCCYLPSMLPPACYIGAGLPCCHVGLPLRHHQQHHHHRPFTVPAEFLHFFLYNWILLHFPKLFPFFILRSVHSKYVILYVPDSLLHVIIFF
jgi:hypothetical protein